MAQNIQNCKRKGWFPQASLSNRATRKWNRSLANITRWFYRRNKVTSSLMRSSTFNSFLRVSPLGYIISPFLANFRMLPVKIGHSKHFAIVLFVLCFTSTYLRHSLWKDSLSDIHSIIVYLSIVLMLLLGHVSWNNSHHQLEYNK